MHRREDPEAYADFDAPPLLDLPDAVPEGIRNRAETEARNAAFGTLLALPDAFALPTARRIADDRNFTEAVLGQRLSVNNSSVSRLLVIISKVATCPAPSPRKRRNTR